jgi:uncharacterized protein (TIGR03083 family)
MSTQAASVTVVQTESERLTQYLAALREEAWSTPSACALWEVRDVVAHLIDGANAYIDWITRGQQGNTAAPPGWPVPGSFTTASPAQLQQMEAAMAQSAVTLRERLGTELLDVFRTAWSRHNRLIANLHAHEWHTPCYNPLGIQPARALVNAAIFELAIHGWDIRSGLEPSARLSPEALAVMPDYFAECLGWFFRPGPRLPTPLRYRFAFTGTRNSQWDLVVAGDTACLEPAAEATPTNVTFCCEVETFALLLCGRRGLEVAVGARQVIPEGDMALVEAFKQWFQR